MSYSPANTSDHDRDLSGDTGEDMNNRTTGTNSGGSGGNPLMDRYREFTTKYPFMTRYSLITICIVWLLSWFLPLESEQLGNISYFTFMQFEVYRIITSPIVGNSLLSIIVTFFFFPQMGFLMESSMGSSQFGCLMLVVTLLTNLIFSALCFLMFATGYVEALFFSSAGFWSILFALITIDCMKAPDAPRQLMFIPVNIPSKYFPFVLYAFFCLFGGLDLANLIAIGLGYANIAGYLDRLRPSSYYLQGLESPGGLLHWMSRSQGYVLAGGAIGHDSWIPVNNVEREDDGSAHGGAQGGSGFNSSHGRTLGGSGGASAGGVSSMFGGWGGGSAATSAGHDQDTSTFPGSGRTLATTGAPSSAHSSFFGSSPAATAVSSSSNASSMSKEAIAARRLAALGIQSQASSVANPLQPSAPPAVVSEASLASLVEMGFDRASAIRALQQSNGDVDAAMHRLVGM